MIELNRVTKRYGEKTVLSKFSCRIPDDTVCAVMAPSGTGKTTLMRLILGLEAPDSGTITGVPERKSAVFQEDRLCPNLSVAKNIRMADGKIEESRMMALLTELGLAADAGTPAQQLSGGMARRAALARALLYDGALLVLDEPFSGLDEENRIAAAAAIRSHRNGRTVILVTHREEDLSLLGAEQCIVLK